MGSHLLMNSQYCWGEQLVVVLTVSVFINFWSGWVGQKFYTCVQLTGCPWVAILAQGTSKLCKCCPKHSENLLFSCFILVG